MNVGAAGIVLIAKSEGFAPYLYNDPANHATVSYGFLVHLGPYHLQRGICAACDKWPRVTERHLFLTAEQGRAMLREKVIPYAEAVERTTRPLNQNEFDALTSFCYNIGPGGYINSSVRTAVNTGGDVCRALMQYIRGTNGVVYEGLKVRRAAECRLFYDGNIPEPEEDEMWVRANGVAAWWTGRTLLANSEGEIRLRIDFPHVPATAKAVDLEVFLSPGSAGYLEVRDGNGNYAGQVNARRLQSVIRVVPENGIARFAVKGVGAVGVDLLGVLGYVL